MTRPRRKDPDRRRDPGDVRRLRDRGSELRRRRLDRGPRRPRVPAQPAGV